MRHLMIVFTWAALFCHESWANGLSCGSVFQSNQPLASDSIESSLIKVRDSLSEVRKAIKASDGKVDKALNNALKNLPEDPREISYLLQGAYRLILAHPDANSILSHHASRQLYQGLEWVKRLEKILGTYQNSRNLVKSAEKIEAPPDFIKFLKRQRAQTARKTIKKLKKEEFMTKDDTVIDTMIERITRLRKIENKGGHDYISDSLKSEIQRVREKVDSEMKPLISKRRYAYHDLEFGAHAFRRSLRWIKVYLLAYKDYFKLTPPTRKLTTSDLALLERYQNVPSLKFGSNGSKSIDQLEFYLLNDLIAQLKAIKGVGEVREKLIVSLTEFGFWNGQKVTAAEATKIITDLMKENFDGIEARTQSLLKIYESTQGFNNLIQEKQ